jgi:hypothetical protein
MVVIETVVCYQAKHTSRGKSLLNRVFHEPKKQPTGKESLMRKRVFAITLSFFLIASFASAKEIGGVSLPDSLTAGNTKLMLNGAGLRKKAMFIKVYAGGLYLKEKSPDAEKIIAADEPMAVRLHFIYDGVSSEKLIGAWNDGFDKATGRNIAPIKKEIDAFNAFFTEEAKKGDIYDFVYIPGEGVTVHMKGASKGTIEGLAFKRALFSIWLGEELADSGLKGLKKGMLGK